MNNADLTVGLGKATTHLLKGLATPFVLIDIGCRDGVGTRWEAIGSSLQAFGFDAAALEPSDANHHYFHMAIGERDGECAVSDPATPYETQVLPGTGIRMASLDSLWKAGTIPLADFIKIDVEGYEPQVLAGAREYLAASNLVGAELETTFNISPTLPTSHFSIVSEPLIKQRLIVTDFAMDRPPTTLNALFCRDFSEERRSLATYPFRPPEPNPTVDTLIKALIMFDLYGLQRPGRKLLSSFESELRPVIDIDRVHAMIGFYGLGNRPFYEKFFPRLGIVTAIRALIASRTQ